MAAAINDQKQTKKATGRQRYGPDSVHSWMTAGACALSCFFSSCVARSGGYVFVAIQANWHANHRDAAWPVLMMAAGIQASGMLSGPLAQRFTVRPVVIAGSVMSSLGLILSSFAPSTTILTITLGGIHGFGAGMVVMTQPICLAQHFVAYKGLATGLNFAGAALAFFAFPVFLEYLTRLYGFRMAILLYAAISLNALAFTLFIRQPHWLARPGRAQGGPPNCQQGAPIANNKDSKNIVTGLTNQIHEGPYSSHEEQDFVECQCAPQRSKDGLTNAGGAFEFSTDAGEPLATKFVWRRVSMKTVFGSIVSATAALAGRTKKKEKTAHEPGSFRHSLTVLKEPFFYLVLYTFLCYAFMFDIYSSLMVDFAVSKGIPVQSAVAMTSLTAVADLAGRLVLPTVADRGLVSRECLLTLVKGGATVVMFLLPHVSSYGAIFTLASCAALYIGCVVVMCSVLIAEFLGVDRVALTYGLVTGITGLTAFVKPLIIGYFRDQWGSYDAVFRLCGLLQGCCFFIWLGVTVAGRHCKRRNWSPRDELDHRDLEACKFAYLPGAAFAAMDFSRHRDSRVGEQMHRRPSTLPGVDDDNSGAVGLSYGEIQGVRHV
uniref:Major facilitator superfamily (MFS) profile domain-containing protein n=1 Tax=Amblyomma maculatum TaxID=34609 RepID=G3MPT5_AMBMU